MTEMRADRPGLVRGASKAFHAFTLIELLTVVAIITILIALVVPAVAPVLRSSNLNRAASMLVDNLALARQVALTQNRDVEVRFYELGAEGNASDKQYRAFRILYADGMDPTKAKPLGKVKYLPEPLILSGDPKFSTLLDHGNASRSGLARRNDEKLPGVTPNPNYVSFLLRPTGGTNLAPVNDNWFITGFASNAPKNSSTGLPDNYFTIQIDPVTGRVRTFRP